MLKFKVRFIVSGEIIVNAESADEAASIAEFRKNSIMWSEPSVDEVEEINEK